MRLEIFMVGQIKEKPYRNLIEQYINRCLGRFQVALISTRDLEDMETELRRRDYIVALDERGQEFDSHQFSEWISKLLKSGKNRVTFCLGSPSGFSDEMKSTFNETLAISRFTLNHQLALLVFCEQLYRALSILFGEPYHK